MIHSSDIEKILDAVAQAYRFHTFRDEMNAALHLASSTRYSPLTSELDSARERLMGIRDELREGERRVLSAEEAKAGA